MSTQENVIKFADLQCDTAGCEHTESLDRADYAEAIGKKCPKCGEVLLTQEHYDEVVSLEDLGISIDKDLDIINSKYPGMLNALAIGDQSVLEQLDAEDNAILARVSAKVEELATRVNTLIGPNPATEDSTDIPNENDLQSGGPEEGSEPVVEEPPSDDNAELPEKLE